MPKGHKNKHYTGEFKQRVVEDMIENNLGYNDTMKKYKSYRGDIGKAAPNLLERLPGG